MEYAAAMAQDTQAGFEQKLQQHRGIVLKVAHSYAWHPEDRADLAQEIAVQLWHAYPRYDASRPFSTWMYRIALNVAISFARDNDQRGRHAVPLDERLHDHPDAAAVDHETQQHVRLLHRFIRQQQPLERALLLLYLEERSQREIADILGLSETNVSTKVGRLKQRLRDEL